MRALQSGLPAKHQGSPEWRQALQLLAGSPRGATEDMLVLGYGSLPTRWQCLRSPDSQRW